MTNAKRPIVEDSLIVCLFGPLHSNKGKEKA